MQLRTLGWLKSSYDDVIPAVNNFFDQHFLTATHERNVWTARVAILKNKTHLVTFHEYLDQLVNFSRNHCVFVCMY